jgi:Ni/Co efflux regulator RcnB
MKKFLIAGIAAITLIPATVVAQPYQGQQQQRHDARDQRHDTRDQRHDNRTTRAPVQETKRYAPPPQHEARWDYSREVRDYKRDNPWRAAPFKYQRFKAGSSIRPAYFAHQYVIRDSARFRWDAPRVNQRWVRHYDDALLVNVRSGRVVKVVRNAFR